MKQIKIPTLGGLVHFLTLKKILKLARESKIESLVLSLDQCFVFKVKKEDLPKWEEYLSRESIAYFYQGSGLVSSIASVSLFEGTSWLSQSLFQSILKNMPQKSSLKIGLVDPKQELTPLLDQELNFLASKYLNFWYLYVGLSRDKSPFLWPVLIYSDALPDFVKRFESLISEIPKITQEELLMAFNSKIDYQYRVFSKPEGIPNQKGVYYDGFHHTIEGYWLGITRTENTFSISMIENLVLTGEQQGIFECYVTPWASFLIKNIKPENQQKWEAFLALNKIPTGHAYFELNWRYQPEKDYFQKIKDKLVFVFYKNKVRAWGITFGLFDKNIEAYTTFAIKVKPVISSFEIFLFDVYLAENFDPKTRNYLCKGKNLSFKELSSVLISQIAGSTAFLHQPLAVINKSTNSQEKIVDQCSVCLTIYDTFSDPEFLQPNFSDLPSTYSCEVCGSPKEKYFKSKIQ
ncbi:MAG: hypothetical protein C4K58_04195 [Flavobacteriaceae bacterium]|nr:MAG: hypothetical protein C4K58_04195 [Flavobacteriaceae bacterium]